MDCGFTSGGEWFRYRAGAIIIEDGCVLMARNDVDPYYYSVGGGVKLGETAEAAVLREVFEETGVHYEIDRLAYIHENFFKGLTEDAGLKCHEIAFYFLMRPRGVKMLVAGSRTEDGKAEQVAWLPIEELPERNAFPRFFADKLPDIRPGIEHIVTHE